MKFYRRKYHKIPPRDGRDLAMSKKLGQKFNGEQLAEILKRFLDNDWPRLTQNEHPLYLIDFDLRRYMREARIRDPHEPEPTPDPEDVLAENEADDPYEFNTATDAAPAASTAAEAGATGEQEPVRGDPTA